MQAEVLSRLGFDDPIAPLIKVDSDILAKFLSTSPEAIELALGKFGQKFRAFVDNIDLEHPHVADIINEIFADREFAKDVVDLLDLSEYAVQKKLGRVLSYAGNKITSRMKFGRSLDSPFNNYNKIRLLALRKDRDKLRLHKKMHHIDLSTISHRGQEVWASQPSGVANFIRHDKAYAEEIAAAETKAGRYFTMGCSGLANQINESVEAYKAHEVYYGFNRVTMTNVAVILAKSLGYKLVVSWSFEDKRLQIMIPAESYGDFCFGFDRKRYKYEPRVYPLHMMTAIPQDVTRIVDHLEAFPEVGGKAIFDSFVVIVPGPNYELECSGGYYKYYDLEGKVHHCTEKEQAIQELDYLLIQGNFILPIVLGEVDGKCFFVSLYQ